MQNGNLKCNAMTCAHNQNMECRAGAIRVAGAQATTTSQTTCSSYVDKSSNAFTNTVDCGCTEPGNISCEACNCTYNSNKNCTADNVTIDASKASCDTFKCGE